MSDLVITILGFVGAVMILGAYFAVSHGMLKPKSWKFQVMNATGAGLLVLYSLHIWALPNVLLNAVWLIVALTILWRIKR